MGAVTVPVPIATSYFQYDQQGVVFNMWYFGWFDDAMTQFLGEVGYPYTALNADCTIVADTPRLAPYTDAMTERLSELLGAPVSVKATRAEGLGALGRAEGIACLAIVLMGPDPGPARP